MIVAYGHMGENSGFPHLYPVLESWIEGWKPVIHTTRPRLNQGVAFVILK